ncbi:MAG TPA: M1 family aminopeptidase [Candidatus Angelobacter sp.]|nr:M1 family aminopeptidase [Candidatus Angelobacter sp.]
MFWRIAWFEIRFWLRSWMLWIFTVVLALAVFFAVGTPYLTLGIVLTNTHHNAPYVIQFYYAIISLFMLVMMPAFINSAALRDFRFNTNQIIFSTPIRRRDFLLGRFVGGTLVSVIPMLGISIGILAAKYMPWAEPEQWGAVNWSGHLHAILLFAVPTVFFMAAVLFAVAVMARNEVVPFVAALGLLIGYLVGDSLLTDPKYEPAAALLDPFGIRTFVLVTKYWTVAEKNTISAGWTGIMLWNRLLWLGVGIAVFLFGYFRFSFAEKRSRAQAVEPESPAVTVRTAPPAAAFHLHAAPWRKLLASLRIHLRGTVTSVPFIIIMLGGAANCILALSFNATEGYGNHTLPVTYWVLDLIRGTLYLFILIVITFFAGVLVWKDREERMDEIVDATPTPEWVAYASRLAALVVLIMLVQLGALLGGIAVQAANGYHRFQLGFYLHELLFRDGSLFLFLAILAFFIHALSPNKYVGYFAYIAFITANTFIWRPLNIASLMVRFSGRPGITYSDFFGETPFTISWDWFTFYWLLFCTMLAVATVMLWPRGKQDRWKGRRQVGILRFHGGWRLGAAVGTAAFITAGGWVYYNTKVANQLIGPRDQERRQADYEKTYKPLEKQPQPRVRSVKFAIDVYPAHRNIEMRGEEVIQNPYSQALNEVHFTLDPNYTYAIDIPGASLKKDDKLLHYQIYHFDQPMQAGENRTIHYVVKSKTRGFENELTNTSVVENGTFFNNTIAPLIGYDPQRMLTDPVIRKRYDLKEVDLMPPPERNCTDDCRDNYLGGHSDWVDVDTVISTSSDQIAIAPGSLVRQWQDGGRNYYEYKLDHPSMNFYSFISANYQVARDEWNGVKLEVYYIKEHARNVPRMMNSVKKSLDYYTKNFGPYMHKEARIIEFPRIQGRFAQSFPGTMPYSESIGFIANLKKPDDIDFVFYVVAHEIGHQWWAHQVIGANMEGATLLSETLSQYSALMVMEKEYGRDMMRKFLSFEMDNYLRSRGTERLKERPLLTVEANQGYIHYRKGSVVLYYLKEMIGEEAVNRALRKVIHQYAYAPPPYPTAYALIDALREETPPELQYLIKDLFEDITLFSNRTLEAKAQKRPDGKYDVTISVEARKYKADAKGNETEVALDDWIDIGAFAKPAKGNQYGDTLYRQRVHMTQKKSTYTFTTASLPEKAGIDPFALLIDRVPDDNMKDVSLSKSAASSSGPGNKPAQPAGSGQ